DRFGIALMLRTIGELHLAQGQLQLAGDYLIRSREMWQELDLPLFRARTERDLAEVQRLLGDSAAATTPAEATGTFRRLGAREYFELQSTQTAPPKFHHTIACSRKASD